MPKSKPADWPRLLIVDDQPESISLLMSFLQDHHLDILVALDGEDGIQKALLGHPELILLDVVMPGLDGYATCQRLKADPRTAGIPVIFLSASNLVADKLLGFSAGGVDYITKPFSLDEVLARISVHIQMNRALSRLDAAAGTKLLDRLGDTAQAEKKLYAKAIRLLDGRLQNPPQVDELARELGCNERKLNQIFRRQSGLSVSEYCFELKMEAARRLLQGSTMQVQLIADHAGYKNSGDFTRAFRRRYGLGPREYRQSAPQHAA